jgi:hypothetical protein
MIRSPTTLSQQTDLQSDHKNLSYTYNCNDNLALCSNVIHKESFNIHLIYTTG